MQLIRFTRIFTGWSENDIHIKYANIMTRNGEFYGIDK